MKPDEGGKPNRLSEPAEKKPDTSSDFSGPRRLRTLNVKLVAIVAGAIVLLVAAGAGAMLYMYSQQGQPKDDAKVSAPKPQTSEGRGQNGPTAEDKRQMEEVLSETCQVKTVTDKDMTFNCGNHDLGPLATGDSVLYASGVNSLPVERKDVKAGQKAKVVYDSGKQTVVSVWVDYEN